MGNYYREELETDGWFIKIGQVYSSPYEPSHFKIESICIDEGQNTDDAVVEGVWVNPKDYNQKETNNEHEENQSSYRVWYFNNYFGLEKDIE